jgi:hypothetical protein
LAQQSLFSLTPRAAKTLSGRAISEVGETISTKAPPLSGPN